MVRVEMEEWRRGLWMGIVLGLLSVSAYGQDPGHIAPELAGKWCYYNLANGDEGKLSNTCVTLNADGTYEFILDGSALMRANTIFPGVTTQQADYGTWSVEGGRIFYESQMHGKGSFQFQKMNQPQDKSVPMIVLNGQAFASSTPRDPW